VSEIREIYFIIDPIHGVQKDSVRGSERECIQAFIQDCYCRIKLGTYNAMSLWEDFRTAGFKVERLKIKAEEIK
jgi:hypothetical protein